MPRNVRDLAKLIGAKGFKKLPKVQKIAQSGHTVCILPTERANPTVYLLRVKCSMAYLREFFGLCRQCDQMAK